MIDYVCTNKDFEVINRTRTDLESAKVLAKMESLEGYNECDHHIDAQIIIVCETDGLKPVAFFYDGLEFK